VLLLLPPVPLLLLLPLACQLHLLLHPAHARLLLGHLLHLDALVQGVHQLCGRQDQGVVLLLHLWVLQGPTHLDALHGGVNPAFQGLNFHLALLPVFFQLRGQVGHLLHLLQECPQLHHAPVSVAVRN
ncbi:unnamed protein product, partial [Ixodes pacificus]